MGTKKALLVGLGADFNRMNVLEQVQLCTATQRNHTAPPEKDHAYSEAIRELAMPRLSFSGVMRGHQVREINFADYHSVVLEDMSSTSCVALVLVLDYGKGKTEHQSGRLEMEGMIRAKISSRADYWRSRCASLKCALPSSRPVF